MPRACIAHDRVVTTARMYLQMGVIGFLLAAVIYGAVMSAIFSHYISAPIPELQYVDGVPRLVTKPEAPRLRALTLAKYFISFNPRNYLTLQLSSSHMSISEKREVVEPELRSLLQSAEVPRETYRKAIFWLTDGRVDQLRWILPTSLLLFPIFGVFYFLAFNWINRRTEKTQFVRGADLISFERMKAALN